MRNGIAGKGHGVRTLCAAHPQGAAARGYGACFKAAQRIELYAKASRQIAKQQRTAIAAGNRNRPAAGIELPRRDRTGGDIIGRQQAHIAAAGLNIARDNGERSDVQAAESGAQVHGREIAAGGDVDRARRHIAGKCHPRRRGAIANQQRPARVDCGGSQLAKRIKRDIGISIDDAEIERTGRAIDINKAANATDGKRGDRSRVDVALTIDDHAAT